MALASTLEAVRDFQRVENPLNRPVAPAVLVMVANQQLVREHRCGDLSRIVGQSAVPDAVTQLELRFEPLIEWFDRLVAPTIEAPALSAEVECPAFGPASTQLLAPAPMRILAHSGLAGA